jgi:hypothetical protein
MAQNARVAVFTYFPFSLTLLSNFLAGGHWLTLVILATQKAEIRRVTV